MASAVWAATMLSAAAMLVEADNQSTMHTVATDGNCSDVGLQSTGAEHECFHHVKWAKYVGIVQDPGYYANYTSLTKYSKYADFQCALWHMRSVVSNEAGTGHGCPPPCTSVLPECCHGCTATTAAPTAPPVPPPVSDGVCVDVGRQSIGLDRECFHWVKRTKYLDYVQDPHKYDAYEGLSSQSSPADFQCALWHMGALASDETGVGHHCHKPCSSSLSQCSTTSTTTAPARGCTDVGMSSVGNDRECFHWTKTTKRDAVRLGYLDHQYNDYPGLTPQSSLVDFQCVLWHLGCAHSNNSDVGMHFCPKPCTSALAVCGGPTPAPTPVSESSSVPWWTWLLIVLPVFFIGIGACTHYYFHITHGKGSTPQKKSRAVRPAPSAPEMEPLAPRGTQAGPSSTSNAVASNLVPLVTQGVPLTQYSKQAQIPVPLPVMSPVQVRAAPPVSSTAVPFVTSVAQVPAREQTVISVAPQNQAPSREQTLMSIYVPTQVLTREQTLVATARPTQTSK